MCFSDSDSLLTANCFVNITRLFCRRGWDHSLKQINQTNILGMNQKVRFLYLSYWIWKLNRLLILFPVGERNSSLLVLEPFMKDPNHLIFWQLIELPYLNLGKIN